MTVCQQAAEQSRFDRHVTQALTAVGPLAQWIAEQRRLAGLGLVPAGHVPAIAGPLALIAIEGGRDDLTAPRSRQHPAVRALERKSGSEEER